MDPLFLTAISDFCNNNSQNIFWSRSAYLLCTHPCDPTTGTNTHLHYLTTTTATVGAGRVSFRFEKRGTLGGVFGTRRGCSVVCSTRGDVWERNTLTTKKHARPRSPPNYSKENTTECPVPRWGPGRGTLTRRSSGRARPLCGGRTWPRGRGSGTRAGSS
jgi:hypothetical protein